jgi:thiaminase (transcriptional activator TenA)
MSPLDFAGHLREQTDPLWQAVHRHPFVTGIGDGTLSDDRFAFYLRQDYVYLIEFCRVLAAAAARTDDLEGMRFFSRLLQATLNTEMELHRRTCAAFGIDAGDLERTEPALMTTAYASTLLRTAWEGTPCDVIAALLPCYAGYVEIAERLSQAGLPGARHCRDWIESYASPEMRDSVLWLVQRLNGCADRASSADRNRWLQLYRTSTRFELLFFEMVWEQSSWPARMPL